jgi:hypothetical protein
MGWDGMGWDGMGWDGMGWDGMRCGAERCDAMRRVYRVALPARAPHAHARDEHARGVGGREAREREHGHNVGVICSHNGARAPPVTHWRQPIHQRGCACGRVGERALEPPTCPTDEREGVMDSGAEGREGQQYDAYAVEG